MATMITSECINCGACEPECPNTAIYQGGVEYEYQGAMHAALANDIFYIVPEKCTECVGFHDQEACAAVCPVDCCIPNPDIPETEDVLLARAKELHPGTEFGAEFPSRFRKGNGAAAPAPSAAPAAEEPAPAAAAPAAAAPATPKAAPPPAAPGRIERPLSPPKARPVAKPAAPRAEKVFPGELPMSFDDAAALLKTGPGRVKSTVKWLVALGQPILGALPFSQKQALERAVADRRYFTAAGATGANALHNFIIYPVVFALIGALVFRNDVFSKQLTTMIVLGLAVAAIETVLRMREGLRGRPQHEIVYRGALYGLPLAPLAGPVLRSLAPREPHGTVGKDGFRNPDFDENLERERRYGEVFRLHEESNGYLLEFEFPRRVPRSAIKEELGLPDEMPDYDYELGLQNGFFTVKGRVTDPNVRRAAAVSPAFPPDFSKSIKLPQPVTGFRHRFRGKNLEVALLRQLAA